MFSFKINSSIARKLAEKHSVSLEEVEECFFNRTRGLLEDTREQNRTHPPTMWFIAKTDRGRMLKVVFIRFESGVTEVKTAYKPNQIEVQIYEKYA